MSHLNEQKCVACRPDAPKATPEEIEQYLPMIPEWELLEVDGVQQLKRSYSFSQYKETLAMVNAIADISEEEGHHPVMHFEFRQLTVSWWSHKIKGLHVNDFVMAAKCDQLYAAG